MRAPLKAVVLVLILCAPLVHAGQGQGQGYIGASVGGARTEGEISLISVDGSDLGFKLFGGYRFTPNFGLEAGYTDLGSVEARQGLVLVEAGVTGWTAEAVGVAPIGESFEVFAKGGLFFAATSIDSTGDLAPGLGQIPYSNTERNAEFTLGIGGAFKFKHLGIRAELEFFGSEVVDQVYLFSLGLEYRF